MDYPKQAWDTLRIELGPELGESLDHARSWVGDDAFLILADQFSPREVIVSCGIQCAAQSAGITLRKGTERDQQVNTAVSNAHAAVRQ